MMIEYNQKSPYLSGNTTAHGGERLEAVGAGKEAHPTLSTPLATPRSASETILAGRLG